MIDENAVQIFKLERNEAVDAIAARSLALNRYLATLDQVIEKCEQVAKLHREKVVTQAQEIGNQQAALNLISDTHNKAKTAHSEWLTTRDSEMAAYSKEKDDKDLKVKTLNQVINGLNSERKTAESSLGDLLGQVSAMNRAVSTLKAEEKDIQDRLSSAKAELAAAQAEAAEERKSFAKLSQDVAILEARVNKA